MAGNCRPVGMHLILSICYQYWDNFIGGLNVSKAVSAFILTVIMGLIGIYLGAFLNLEGYLGIIFSIATMGAFIISAIEKAHMKWVYLGCSIYIIWI